MNDGPLERAFAIGVCRRPTWGAAAIYVAVISLALIGLTWLTLQPKLLWPLVCLNPMAGCACALIGAQRDDDRRIARAGLVLNLLLLPLSLVLVGGLLVACGIEFHPA